MLSLQRLGAVTVLSFSCLALQARASGAPDYSKESVLIQTFLKQVTFSADGTWRSTETAAFKVQSEAGVRQFGVLSFPYDRDNQAVEVEYVRVRKADGNTVATPGDSIQDASSEITKAAPTFSDLREKQIPVKALGVGDILEYKVQVNQTKAEIAGQFWYHRDFITGVVALDERLEIDVPADQYVNVVSQKVKPELREEPGHRIYCWKTAQLEPTPERPKQTETASSAPSVQVTTFKSWAESGRGIETSRRNGSR